MKKIIISPTQQNGIEEDLVRPISELLFLKLLDEKQIEPILIPNYNNQSDEVALWNAIQFSNSQDADFHIEIHADAGGYARGCSGLYVSTAGKEFITPITQELMATTPWPDVGIKQRFDLGALNQTTAVAGLIEISFYDNSEELNWMRNNQELIAETLKIGIYKALNIQTANYWEQKYKALLNQYYAFRQGVVDVMNKFT